MDDWIRDAHVAFRGLLIRPGFTAVFVLTLAFGIGANTAIFSLVDAVLFEPLPFPEPERLVQISETAMREQLELRSLSYPMLAELGRDEDTFEDVAGIARFPVNVSEGDEPERILADAVTPSYFRILGIAPLLGRVLDREDGGLDLVHPSVVLTEGYWSRRFGRDEGILGRDVQLNGVSSTVVGVVSSAGLSGDASIFVPLETTHLFVPRIRPRRFEQRTARWLDAIGRLKPGVSPEVLAARMERTSARLRDEFPRAMENRGVTTFPLEAQMLGDVQRSTLLLMLSVGLVLLIVCANLANLLLARSVRRRREVALRFALGATRFRVLRQLLTESLLLSLGGGLIGLLMALWTRDALRNSGLFDRLPDYVSPRIDVTAALVALGLSLLTALLFGSAPAFASTRTNLSTTLRGVLDKGASHFRGAGGLGRGALVTVQVALALSLTVASALIVQSLVRQQRIDPGFRASGVHTMRVQLPQASYDADGARSFVRTLRERLEAVPEIRSVAFASDVPLVDGYSAFVFRTEEMARRDPEERMRVYHHEVTPGFFSTMGIPLLSGRDFSESDSREAPLVVIVSEKFARAAWPDQDPIGRRVSASGIDGPWREVVGLVSDVRYRDLILDPVSNPDDPDVYVPFAQAPRNGVAIVAATRGIESTPEGTARFAARIREEVLALDSAMPVFGIASMSEVLSDELAVSRVTSSLVMVFGSIALILATLGLYGLLSHWVAERSRDIGIRMALGAERGRIIRSVLRQGLSLVVIGLAAGTVLSFSLARFLESRLYEVSATDLPTLASSVVLLVFVGLLAAYVPARRATRLSPVVVLKED